MNSEDGNLSVGFCFNRKTLYHILTLINVEGVLENSSRNNKPNKNNMRQDII